MAVQKADSDKNYIDSSEFGSDAAKYLGYVLPGIGQLGAGIFGALSGKKKLGEATSEYDSARKNAPAFQIAPEIKQELAQRAAEYNAEDEAIKQAKAEYLQQQANYGANVERNAQSGSQALGAMAASNRQTNQDIARLAAQQFADKMQKGQALSGARNAMAQQRQIQFADQQARNEAAQAVALGKMQAERYNLNEANKNIFAGIPGAAMGLAGLLKGNKDENNNDISTVTPTLTAFTLGPSAFNTPDMNWNKKKPLETVTTVPEEYSGSIPLNTSKQNSVVTNSLNFPGAEDNSSDLIPRGNRWVHQNDFKNPMNFQNPWLAKSFNTNMYYKPKAKYDVQIPIGLE